MAEGPRTGTTRSPHSLTAGVVFQRVDALLGLGLLVEQGGGPSTGGRPPTKLAFDAASGVVQCADLGATHCRLAVSDLDCTVLAELPGERAIADGPDAVLAWVRDRFAELLDEAGRS